MIASAVRALLVCLLVGSSLGAISFDSSTNVSSSLTKKHGWEYRSVSLTTYDMALFNGANFLSIGVKTDKKKVSSDILSGSCYVNNNGMHPFAYVTHFASMTDWSLSPGAGSSWATNTNFTASTGYVGSSYLRVEETAPNGTIVASQNLRGALIDSSNGVSWSVTDKSQLNAEPKYITFTASVTGSFTIDLSFIASSYVGILAESGAVVGPTSFESVIRIRNWPYRSPSNKLSLLIGVGTGSTSLSGSGRTLVSKGGDSQMYFSLAKDASISGGLEEVKITVNTNTTGSIDDNNFASQLSSVYSAKASFHVVKVEFPAGAADILYDPSLGTGTSMEEARTGFAYKTQALTLLVVLAVFVHLM